MPADITSPNVEMHSGAYDKSPLDTESLRYLLKTKSKDLHDVADSHLEGMLFEKKLTLDSYKVYVSQLYFIYEVLEEALERHKENEVVGPIHFPDELNRMEALKMDLEYFYGSDWLNVIECLPTVRKYANWISERAQNKPEVLVPHSYVRYFGDLSGGQILAKVFRRMYNLPDDGSGVKFFDFSHVEDLRGFKTLYTGRLDSLELSEDLKEAFVEETRHCFQLNINMLKELDRVASAMPNGYILPNVVIKDKSAKKSDPSKPPVQKGELTQNWVGKTKKGFSDAFWNTSLAILGVAMVVTACPWMRGSILEAMH